MTTAVSLEMENEEVSYCIAICGSSENPVTGVLQHSGLLPFPGRANGSVPPLLEVPALCLRLQGSCSHGWLGLGHRPQTCPFPHLQPQLPLALDGGRLLQVYNKTLPEI